MFLRPAGHRVVQRQSRSRPDAVWISEDALHDVFQCFVTSSAVCKRRGSFVPGPLECRRRLGKRGMGYSLEQSPPAAIPGIPGLWAWLVGEVDNTQWRWEAPRSPPEKVLSPDVHRQAFQSEQPIDVPKSTVWQDSVKCRVTSIDHQWSLPAEVEELCIRIEAGDEGQIWDDVRVFNKTMKQNLISGSLMMSATRIAIVRLPETLRSSTLAYRTSDQLCCSILEAVWEGLMNCSALMSARPGDEFMQDYLWEINRLSPSLQWQTLVSRIIKQMTADQICRRRALICLVVQRWIESWTIGAVSMLHHQAPEHLSLLAQRAVSDSASSILNTSHLCKHVIEEPIDVRARNSAYQAVCEARRLLDSALEIVTEAELMSSSQRASFNALRNLLMVIPGSSLRQILWTCTVALGESFERHGGQWTKHQWMLLIAELPGVDDILFTRLCLEMDARSKPLDVQLYVQLLLSQWVSQGHLPNHLLVRNTLATMSLQPPDFGGLLYAIHLHGRETWTKMEYLSSLLNALGKFELVPDIFRRMRQLGMKVPADVFANAIETMVDHDVNKATVLRHLGRLPLYACPKLLMSLVRDPLTPPNAIWKMLGLPSQLKLQTVATPRWWRVKSLLVRMIVEFAYCHERSQKVAFRNVYRYIRLAQLCKMPITADVSRALTHAGIIRRMMLGKFVRGQTLYYILQIVEEAEGTVAARVVENTVHEWNKLVVQKQLWKRAQQLRDANPLRTGPVH